MTETLEHTPVQELVGIDDAERLFSTETVAEVNAIFEKAEQDHLADLEGRNPFQKVADATNDIVTLPNAITVAGLYLVLDGAREIETPEGMKKVIIGRSADLIDGPVARITKTSSETGEMADATADKIAYLDMLYFGAKSGMVSAHKLGFIAAQNVANIGATLIAKARGREIHSTRAGKHAAAGTSATIASEVLSKQIKERTGESDLTAALDLVDDMAFGINVQLGVQSSWQYIKAALDNTPVDQRRVLLTPENIRDIARQYGDMVHTRYQDEIKPINVIDSSNTELEIDPATALAILRGYDQERSVLLGTSTDQDGNKPETKFSVDGTRIEPHLDHPYSTKVGLAAGAIVVGAHVLSNKAGIRPEAAAILRKGSRMAMGPAIYHLAGPAVQKRVNGLKQRFYS